MADEKYEKFVLEEDQELRISTQENDEENIEIEMVYGTGEIFGYELKKDVRYTFGQGDKFSIFSFQGRIIYDYDIFASSNIKYFSSFPIWLKLSAVYQNM